jgi:hypothetical protein
VHFYIVIAIDAYCEVCATRERARGVQALELERDGA